MQRPVDTAATAAEPAARNFAAATAMPVLFALSLAHLLNDMMQSLVPAIYPIIKETHDLSFSQIGLITLTFELTASLLQPAVGHFTDKRPLPFSMVAGMGFTLVGLVVLAWAPSYPMLLLGAALVGTGSSIFHPEATRAVAGRIRRPPRFRAVDLPGRWPGRIGAGPGAGGLHRGAMGAGQRCLVCSRGHGRDGRAAAGRALVRAATPVADEITRDRWRR